MEVGAFCDRLTGNLASVTSGDEVRAVLLAMSVVEGDRRADRRVVVGGIRFLDAALVILRVRLVGAVLGRECDDDAPVPYQLTPAGVAATDGPP